VIEQARLIATLRQVGVPIAVVREWLALDPAGMAEQVSAFWREDQWRHDAPRRLVRVTVRDGWRSGVPSRRCASAGSLWLIPPVHGIMSGYGSDVRVLRGGLGRGRG
jgi:hypothetical protein